METKNTKRKYKPKLIKIVNDNISTSSHSKESIKWSFSKASRFIPMKKERAPQYCDLPSTLNERTCSFGIGKRWSPINASGKDSPPPGAYEAFSLFGVKDKGPSFKKKYSGMLLMYALPGPGAYNPYAPLGKEGPKFSFRQKLLKNVRMSTPPPNSYHPNYRLVEKENFKQITFGTGERSKICNRNDMSPGPGAYEISSCFKSQQFDLASRSTSLIQLKRPKTPLI